MPIVVLMTIMFFLITVDNKNVQTLQHLKPDGPLVVHTFDDTRESSVNDSMDPFADTRPGSDNFYC